MDTKKINALLKVIEYGSLTSAAEALGYTQPGLTNMMNTLEDELGTAILIRSKTGVRLSEAGQELLPYIQTMAAAAEDLDKAVDAVRSKSYATLRIGAYSSIARKWLPTIMQEFHLAAPDVGMSASMQDIKIMYDAVRSNKLDIAFVSYSEKLMNGLDWTPLANDELVAVFPGTYSPSEGPFPMKYFSGLDFLMPSGGFDADIIPLFDDFSAPANIRYTNMDDAAIVSMVEHGFGVSIMSDLIMQGISGSAAVAPLNPPAFRKLGIIVKEKRRNESAMRHFIASAQKTVSEIFQLK